MSENNYKINPNDLINSRLAEVNTKKPNYGLRRLIATVAIGAALAGGGFFAYEKATKPDVEFTQKFEMLDSDTIKLFDGTVIKMSKDTKTYEVQEGDGMDVLIYQIDGIGSINHADFDAVESYIEDMPENYDTFHDGEIQRIMEKGDIVVIPAELKIVSEATIE